MTSTRQTQHESEGQLLTTAATAATARRAQKLSVLHGPVDPPLVDLTLGELLELQAYQHGGDECLVMPWTGARWTYHELHQQSTRLAQALLQDLGVGPGDCVGIMAGNCEQYAAVFFAVAKVGAILVILNSTYTPTEALYCLRFSDCKVLFTTRTIGRLDNAPLLAALDEKQQEQEQERQHQRQRQRSVLAPAAKKTPLISVVMLRGEAAGYTTYHELVGSSSNGRRGGRHGLHRVMSRVLPHQVVNLQFTSGTTGLPKAAMLTHQ